MLTIEICKLSFDHHFNNQDLFSSNFILNFFAIGIQSGPRWDRGVHKG
jgi:hypothetical protein